MIKPQKALHLYLELEKKRTKVQDDLFMIFEKYDGWYGFKQITQSLNSVGNIMSRAGREIPSLTGLSRSMAFPELSNNIDLKGTVIFEILVEGVPVFKDLNGMLNRSKGLCECKGAYLMVHDFIPDNNHNMPTLDRYALAQQYVQKLDRPSVRIAPVIGMGDIEEVQAEAETIWARKSKDVSNEGAIGKRIGAPYSEGKRNKDIIKVKMEVTLDMLVIGVERGKGKYEYTAGKLTVRQKNGLVHSVSGMTDTERDLWWEQPHLITGQVVEIQAMQQLSNGSLREGRFKAVRFDKTEEDID